MAQINLSRETIRVLQSAMFSYKRYMAHAWSREYQEEVDGVVDMLIELQRVELGEILKRDSSSTIEDKEGKKRG